MALAEVHVCVLLRAFQFVSENDTFCTRCRAPSDDLYCVMYFNALNSDDERLSVVTISECGVVSVRSHLYDSVCVLFMF